MKKKNKPVRRGNIVNLTPSGVSVGIKKFEKSKSLGDFLGILNIVAQTSIKCDFVFDCWEDYVGEIIDKNPLPIFLDWIGCLRFIKENTQTNPQSDLNETDFNANDESIHNSNISSSAKSIVEAVAQDGISFDEIGNRFHDSDFTSGIFMAAWPFEDLLKEHAGIDEAARLISSYMNALYSDEGIKEGLIIVQQKGLVEFVKNKLLPWIFQGNKDDFETYTFIIGILIGEINPLDPDTFPTGFSFLKIAQVIPSLTPKFFSLFVEVLTDEIGIDLPYSKLPKNESNAIQKLLDTMLGYDGITAESFNSISCIYCWSNFEIEIPIMQNAIDRFIAMRRNDPYGPSPISWDIAWSIRENISRICSTSNITLERHDLAYLIAPTWPSEYGWLGGFSYDNVWSGEEAGFPKTGIMRKNIYLTVFDCALNEGWYEFANACLAFFLFSQPLYCQNQLFIYDDWPNFSEKLHKASKLPGFDKVREAARFAIDCIISNEKYNKIDALNLEGWANKTTNTKNLSKENPVEFYNKIQDELIESLGESVWNNTNLITRRQLQDAEKQWSAMHSHLGRGVHDFGSLAISYIKPIEVELRNRLLPILQTKEYDNYRRSQGRLPEKNPTLGTLLHLLNDFKKLPTSFQEKIKQSGIGIYSDRVLLKQLFELLNLRNKAAHSDSFIATDIVELRGLLYDKQTLKRFFELI